MRRIVCTATLVLGVLLVGTSLAADGACLDACRTARKGCLARAKAERTAMKADCRDLGGHVSCLTSAVAHTKNLVKDCRSAVSTCRACCDGGGAPQKCSTNCDGESYNSTWEGIQKHIFAQHDCAQQACHSSGAKQGGLDLSPDVAYKNLKTRRSGTVSFIQVDILVPRQWTVGQGHDVLDEIESRLASIVPNANIVTHLEPKD